MRRPRHILALLGLKKDERMERLSKAEAALEVALRRADAGLTQTMNLKDPRIKRAIEEANEAAIALQKKEA